MKKKLLLFFAVGFLFITLASFAKSYLATWTSTCGVTHYTTFSGSWTTNEMAMWIAETNANECGNYPSRVTFN